MTDFDKTAREIAACTCAWLRSYSQKEHSQECAINKCAAALKAAYNEGLRDSITRIEDLFQKVP